MVMNCIGGREREESGWNQVTNNMYEFLFETLKLWFRQIFYSNYGFKNSKQKSNMLRIIKSHL